MEDVLGSFGLALALLCIVLLIAWIILPFALIGTKPLLRELIAEVKQTNALLAQLAEEPRTSTAPPRSKV